MSSAHRAKALLVSHPAHQDITFVLDWNPAPIFAVKPNEFLYCLSYCTPLVVYLLPYDMFYLHSHRTKAKYATECFSRWRTLDFMRSDRPCRICTFISEQSKLAFEWNISFLWFKLDINERKKIVQVSIPVPCSYNTANLDWKYSSKQVEEDCISRGRLFLSACLRGSVCVCVGSPYSPNNQYTVHFPGKLINHRSLVVSSIPITSPFPDSHPPSVVTNLFVLFGNNIGLSSLFFEIQPILGFFHTFWQTI